MIGFKRIRKNVYILIGHGIVARALSFLQPILIAFYIGTSMSTDTYFLAFTASMLLTKIITDGLLLSLIPIYQQIDKRDGMKGRVEFTNNVLNTYASLGIVLAIIGILSAPWIIRIMGPGFGEEEFAQTVRLFRIGVPIIIFDFIRVIGSAYLQSIHAFKAGARSGIVYNLVFIIYLLFFSPYFGVEGLMVAGIIAVISQAIILWKPVFKGGYKYKPHILLKDRLLIRLNTFMFPILLGVGINEVNLVVDNAVGSTLETGTIAELNYANDTITFFIMLIIVSLVTAIFPVLSQRFRDDNSETLRKSFNYSIKLMVIVSLPLAILLMTMAEPIIRLFYQRGMFTYEDTLQTASILRYYSPAIIGMSLLTLLNRIFYAVHSLFTPVVVGLIGLVLNAVLSIIFAQTLGAKGLALGTSISVIIIAIYALVQLHLGYKVFHFKDTMAKITKIIFAGILMATVILFINHDFARFLEVSNLGNMFLVVISAVLGVGIYSGTLYILKV